MEQTRSKLGGDVHTHGIPGVLHKEFKEIFQLFDPRITIWQYAVRRTERP